MGGGASKAGPKDSSMAIKEIKERAEKLEREVERLEVEKKAYEKQLADRGSDIEKLGEFNRNLEREKESLKGETDKAKQDMRSAEKAVDVLRREMDEVKANAKKFEANLREINGDLIAEKEDHASAREEIARIGEMLTAKVKEQEEIEKRVIELEEEKQELDNMLRLTSENMDMYKDLSAKLMVKKPKEEAAPAVAAPIVQATESKPKAAAEAPTADESSDEKLLAGLKPKQAGRFKVVIISTFEDFFLEREAIRKNTVRKLSDWCDQHNCVLEMVDLWEGVLRDQYTVITHGFYVPTLYFQEIDDADIVLVLLGEKYGSDVAEDTCAAEANVRPWMSRHRSQHNRYGSILELAAVYAAFIVGIDSNLPQNLTQPRVLTYMRDPSFIQGLPESMTKHFAQEGSRQTAKLEQLKTRLKKAGYIRNNAYPDPHALSTLIQEDLQLILEKSQKKPIGDIEIELLMHDAFMEAHKWIGQGDKGVQLPENVSSLMERIRKYVVNDTPQPLVIVGEAGSGRSSMCQANVRALSKRFPPPDTLIISHYAGISNAARDPILWMYRVCKILKQDLKLQLHLPNTPSEMISDFPLWLEAASATGLKLFLILDGIDLMSHGMSSDDPIGFLPKSMPEGIRCILTTGPGNALTSLAQRGCGAITIWPMDEKQKETLVSAYLGHRKKELDKKGILKLVKSKLCSIPQFLTNTLAEIDAIGVLDGKATMEPMLYYLEADNMSILTEKSVYRWESAYNGKIIGGTLVRDALTCIWASRRGLRRSEISALMRLSPSQLSQLLLCVQEFLTSQTGLFNFQSQSLGETVARRYLPTSDSKFEAHSHLATFFDNPDNASLNRRVDELPWQIAEANDPERLCKCITKASLFELLYQEGRRNDLFAYVAFLQQKDAHLNLGVHCKTSRMVFEQQDPKPEAEDVVLLNHKYGSWLAEIGFMEVSLQFLLKAMEGWSEVLEEDDSRVAASCETLAKVLANMRSPEADKYFERAERIRQRLGKKEGPTNEFGTLCNEYGLHLKRQNKPQEAMRLFIRAQDIWSRVWGQNHLMVANALLNLCTVCYAVGSLQQAYDYAEQAKEIRRDAVGPNHPLYAEALVNLAAVELARDRGGRMRKEADQQLWQGIGIFERTRGGQHPDTLWARSFVGDEDKDFSDEDADEDDAGNVLEGAGDAE